MSRFIGFMCLCAALIVIGLRSFPAMRAVDLPSFVWLLPAVLLYDVLSSFVRVRALPPLSYYERGAGFIVGAVLILLLEKIL